MIEKIVKEVTAKNTQVMRVGRDRYDQLTGLILIVTGLGLAFNHFQVIISQYPPQHVAFVAAALLPLIMSLTVVGFGIWLTRSNMNGRAVKHVFGWWILAIVVTFLVGVTSVLYQLHLGMEFQQSIRYIVLNNVSAGAVGGFLLGLYSTKSRQHSRQLAREREQLVLLTRIVRHDIRNNLAVILGMNEEVRRSVDEEQQRFTDSIQKAGEEAVALTENARAFVETIDESSAEGREEIRLDNVVQHQVNIARETYPDADIEVNEIPPVIVEGSDLISTVFRNLIDNAVKHCDKAIPEVELQCHLIDDVIHVAIADNGPGIPDERKEEIFGKGETGLDSAGTGIGMYLVRTLVNQHGGDVWVEDNDSEGSVFVVELPIAE